jgi:hypothetical protein
MPSMVSAERMRSRISACQPCEISSFMNMMKPGHGFARIYTD